MTAFNKRLERLAAGLPELPQKMTFIYEDGERVEVVGFLAAVKQNTKRDGLVDVLGGNEGLKKFLLCSQCDVNTLWADEAGGGQDEPADNTDVGRQGPAVCTGPSSDCPAQLGKPRGGHQQRRKRCGTVRRPDRGGAPHGSRG